jgi:hypothetical protein
MEVIKAAEEAAMAESEAATYEAAAVAVAHGLMTQEEVEAFKRYRRVLHFLQAFKFYKFTAYICRKLI